MDIKKAEFLSCCTDYRKCPEASLPEYAFVGRSNVGKSSLINRLCNNSSLAKTSSTPGKTQAIVHFRIDNSWYMADLPGYGYARITKKQREKWKTMTRDYLLKRPNLACVFVLVDLRIPPQKLDLDFIRFLGENSVPLCLIGTKADKIGDRAVALSLQAIQKALSEEWDPLPPFIVSSAQTGIGKDEILEFIQASNRKCEEASNPGERKPVSPRGRATRNG